MNTTEEQTGRTPSTPPGEARSWIRWLPLILTLLWAGWYASKVRVPKGDEWASGAFGRIPVVVDGRHMPIDTYARTALTLIRTREDANFEPWKSHFASPKVVTATEWAIEVMMNPAVADTRPVFRIDHPDVKGLFGVPMEASELAQRDGKHYSWVQLQPHWDEFVAEVRRASGVDSKSRSSYEQALIGLWKAAGEYRRLKVTLGPVINGDLAATLPEYNKRIDSWREAFQAQLNGEPADPSALMWGDENRGEKAPLIAPRKSSADVDESLWASAFEEVLAFNRGEPVPALDNFAAMAKAYRGGDPAGFAAAVDRHFDLLKKAGFDTDLKKASREQLLNFASPFYFGTVIAIAAGLLGIAVWFNPKKLEWARLSAVWLIVLVLLIHTAGLLARYLIEGKPPVTNLYTSAIFIGWAAAIFGLLLEVIFPHAIGIVVAAAIEFGALMIAHYLATRDGTTFTVLEAVLNTNFWLATHVVIVTLGYASTFVAGFLAIIYVVRAAFSPDFSPDIARILTRMVYAIICFATLFSFVGTVLGGLWADQSWGRFWGWDVKENGALMIVLWNAILLHARWGGLVRERGLMCFALGGNIVTAWSWFGVNNLSIGLHSYGFTTGVFIALLSFVASQIALMLVAATCCDEKVVDRSAVPA
jgi:ABC-type transport system involved in cytochrome c biogenesis permease subunit